MTARNLLLLGCGGGGAPAATFPVIEGVATSIDISGGATATHDLPAGIQSGELLLLEVRSGSITESHTTPTGWSLLDTKDSNGRTSVFYRTADGTEGATVSFAHDGTRNTAAITRRISGWQGTPEILFEALEANDPPSLTPTWGSANTLFIAGLSMRRGDNAITAAPTDYGSLQTIGTSTATSSAHARIGSAHRELAATSDDPGAFTATGTVQAPHSWTIAIRPA